MVSVFVDFTKAFDHIWINGLLVKLEKLEIKGNMFAWIKNFLNLDRTMQVRVGGSAIKYC